MKSACVSRYMLLIISALVAFLVFSMGGTNAFAGEPEGAFGSNDSGALEGNPNDLSFVYMGDKSISLGDEQYVVVGFAVEVGQPELRVVDEESGAFQVIDPVNFVDGAALFALPGAEASTYRVSPLRICCHRLGTMHDTRFLYQAIPRILPKERSPFFLKARAPARAAYPSRRIRLRMMAATSSGTWVP